VVLSESQRRCTFHSVEHIGVLLEIAVDLTKALTATDRYQRLLDAWRRVHRRARRPGGKVRSGRRRLGLGLVRLRAEALGALQAYPWPGNVRELDNVLSRVVLKAAGNVPRGTAIVLEGAHFQSELAVAHDTARVGAPVQLAPIAQRPLREATLDFQRATIRRVLQAHAGNWSAAARALGMHRSNLHHLASRLGVREA